MEAVHHKYGYMTPLSCRIGNSRLNQASGEKGPEQKFEPGLKRLLPTSSSSRARCDLRGHGRPAEASVGALAGVAFFLRLIEGLSLC